MNPPDLAHAVEHLRVVEDCPKCEALRSTCDALAAERDHEVEDRANLERESRRLLRKIRTLENELSDRRRNDPLYETAETIFEFWRRKVRPKARTFGDERLKMVLTRLAEYPPRYICEAVVGAAIEPYMRDGERFDDLALICRNARHLERFHDVYVRHGGECKCELT